MTAPTVAEQQQPLPVEYYLWLATIEPDVRLRDLTADEIAGLVTALRTRPTTDRELIERLREALKLLRSKLSETFEVNELLADLEAATALSARPDAWRVALERIAHGDCDSFSGDPMQWPSTIARVALGLHPHPNGNLTEGA